MLTSVSHRPPTKVPYPLKAAGSKANSPLQQMATRQKTRPSSPVRFDLDHAFDILLSRLKIAVVHGASNESPDTVIYRTHNPRTWKSYSSVAADVSEALERVGFRHVSQVAEGLGLAAALQSKDVQMTWLNTGGVQGHGPMCHASAALESLGIPYVGHSPAAAALLDDKPLFKAWLSGMGLPTTPFIVWHPKTGSAPRSEDPRVLALQTESGGPLIVKPASGRASRHVVWVSSADELAEAVHEVHGQTKDRVMIEPFLPGRELCVAVGPPMARAGDRFEITSSPVCVAAIERRLDPDEKIFTSADLRPIKRDRARILDAEQDGELINSLEHIARRVFNELSLDFLIRLDLRENQHGQLMVMEANPKPDLASCRADGKGSLIALGLKEKGLSYDDLIACQIMHRVRLGAEFCPRALGPVKDLLVEAGIQLNA